MQMSASALAKELATRIERIELRAEKAEKALEVLTQAARSVFLECEGSHQDEDLPNALYFVGRDRRYQKDTLLLDGRCCHQAAKDGEIKRLLERAVKCIETREFNASELALLQELRAALPPQPATDTKTEPKL